MPRLWTNTIETHRREVHQAILDSTAALVAAQGIRSVTMTEIAQTAGIGRATLYKYFGDVEGILLAWHEREIAGHLAQLSELRDEVDDPGGQLARVLRGYAHIAHATRRHQDSELGAFLHRDSHVQHAEQQLLIMIRQLVTAAVSSGTVRCDVPASELAAFCLHSLGAARFCSSKAAVDHVATVVLDGLRPVD